MVPSAALKRLFGDEFDQEDFPENSSLQSKKRRPLADDVREAMKLQSSKAFQYVFESFFHEVVRDEIRISLSDRLNSGLCFHCSGTCKQTRDSATRRWQLKFRNQLPHTLYVGSKMKANDDDAVQVVILDTFLNQIVDFGHFSSLKVEIVVLHGDFGGTDTENWSEKEFYESLVHERKDKRPLLAGDLNVTLKKGIGYFGEVAFTDNSSWMKSGNFRLGARACEHGFGGQIQEAVSESFKVKDHRGELYKKHYPPLMDDKVWRLEKIGKDGKFHKRLKEHGIETVENFLRQLVMNPDSLRNILCCGTSNRIWEAIVQHARKCHIGSKEYSYYDKDQNVVLYFNSILEVIGVKFAGSHYLQLSELTTHNQASVNRLKEVAYKNLHDIVEMKEPRDILPTQPLQTEASMFTPLTMIEHHPNPFTCPDEWATESEIIHEPPSHYSIEPCGEFPVQQLLLSTNNFDTTDHIDIPLQNYEIGSNRYVWTGHRCDLVGDDSTVRMPNSEQFSTTWDFGNKVFHASQSQIYCYQPSPASKWMKIRGVLKFRMKLLATKRSACQVFPGVSSPSFSFESFFLS